MKDRIDIFAYLETLTKKPVPTRLTALDDEVLGDIEVLLSDVLERERAGLDSLFSSMTHTMKYIPNLLLQSLTTRYIEPPIAARICEDLSVKQSVGVANGLDSLYVAQTCEYMSAQYAAELVSLMNKKKASAALALVLANSPHVAVAVFENLSRKTLVSLVSSADIKAVSAAELGSRRDELLALY